MGDKTVLVLKHDKASVDATPAGDPELSRRLGSPVVAFAEIFRASDGLDALEAASKYHQLSIDTTLEGDPALLERQFNLGASLIGLGASGTRLILKYDLAVNLSKLLLVMIPSCLGINKVLPSLTRLTSRPLEIWMLWSLL